MATHDYVIANGTGAAVRSDINGALAAIVSQNSNASAPATTYAYMSWADTSAGVMKMRNGANSAWISLYELDGTFLASDISLAAGSAAAPSLFFTGDTNTGLFSPGADTVALATAGSNRLHISSGGLVGIGTTTVNSLLEVRGTTDGQNVLHLSNSAGTSDGSAENQIRVTCNGNSAWANLDIQAYQTIFTQNGGEKARIDPNGRLLVGTSSSLRSAALIQIAGTSYPALDVNSFGTTTNPEVVLRQARGTQATPSVVVNGDSLGKIGFQGYEGANYYFGATIEAYVDAAVTSSGTEMPGRLVFSTTADGASSPTERMRITQGGNILLANTTGSAVNTGFIVVSDGGTFITRSGDRPFYVNRLANDGNLVEFAQDNATEGTISVSGTTVSYNGAHLSRWSQLPGGQERTEILRGSVLSNIDEMCEWGDEDNEQLNRMKVSEVEGDKNVSGVFQAWDDDDDTYTNDFYCAMTGDFIIRIAEGVTVERGDLLMSAGDGTAKPQDDDIIRSKTIAKVTSTTVSCTYDDGSYCVPCVLMAC